MAIGIQPLLKQRLLDVRHLSVDYAAGSGAVHAVSDVSFTLERGQVLGLAGESGSGKSTLAYAITRLLRPPAQIVAGEITYYPQVRDGTRGQRIRDLEDDQGAVNVLELTPRQLRAFRWDELAIVFQSAMNSLNPVMSIETQIIDVLKAHPSAQSSSSHKERARELLRLVGISSDRLHSYPHELSGGMRQRAAIAIALALNPDLIIMDEPTTALDVVVQREILNEIMSLRKQLNFSVIFITHDLSLLLELADQVAIMYAGRVVEWAKNHELYRRPLHPYTYGLLHSFPSIHGPKETLTGIPGSPPDLRAVPTGCAFNPRCDFAFASCHQVVPELATPVTESPRRRVACHLYSPTLHPAGAPISLAPREARSATKEAQV